MTPEENVTVTGLGIADVPGSFVTREVERLMLAFGGIEGDRHFGLTAKAGVRQKHHPLGTPIANARQLSIVSDEELAQIAATLEVSRVGWPWLGANLCLKGLAALTQTPASTRLLFPSGACLVIDGENLPCTGPGKQLALQPGAPADAAPKFVKAAFHRRGLVGWVERPGPIALGDRIVLVRP